MSRYSVKQVAALTGVPAATLRAWERRYAVVAPERTESRYRLYDDADVVRLQEMARLVAAGTPASLAAEEVAAWTGRKAVVGGGSGGSGGDGADGGGFDEEARPAVVTVDEVPTAADLARAARTFDAALLDKVLDDAFSMGSFERVVERWLMPALEALGASWAVGRVDVAGEHFVSAAVLRRLSQAFEAAGLHRGAPVVLVGLPAGATHELGVVAFATCLRRQGIDVRYLGADVPRESWVQAVTVLEPAAVVLSVPLRSDVREASALLAELFGLGDSSSTALFVGGGSSEFVTIPEPASVLPHSLSSAATQVSETVRT